MILLSSDYTSTYDLFKYTQRQKLGVFIEENTERSYFNWLPLDILTSALALISRTLAEHQCTHKETKIAIGLHLLELHVETSLSTKIVNKNKNYSACWRLWMMFVWPNKKKEKKHVSLFLKDCWKFGDNMDEVGWSRMSNAIRMSSIFVWFIFETCSHRYVTLNFDGWFKFRHFNIPCLPWFWMLCLVILLDIGDTRAAS